MPGDSKGDESPDPLDLFMENLENQKGKTKPRVKKGERLDFETEDNAHIAMTDKEMAVHNAVEELRRAKGQDFNSDDEVYAAAKVADRLEREEDTTNRQKVDYDEMGNTSAKKKQVPILRASDHPNITYENFVRNIYLEHSEVSSRKEQKNDEYLKQNNIRVSGQDQLKVCSEFKHMNLRPSTARALTQKFKSPTAIQAAAVPYILSGRDVIAVAETGSGKTLAYILPLVEKLDRTPQHNINFGNWPRMLVVAPTHELSKQIYEEAEPFFKAAHVKTLALYGGANMHSQARAIQKGVDVIIGTPGRIVNLIQHGELDCRRICILVLDEADRMLQLGFKKQIQSIIDQIRPDRQTFMFSATFPNEIRYLANAVTASRIHITTGNIGAANSMVQQIVEVLLTDESKTNWLLTHIASFAQKSAVLVFASMRRSCEELAAKLRQAGISCGVLHGEFMQRAREKVLKDFRGGKMRVLVATDVAARGIHVDNLDIVVCFDAPRNPQAHINRVGRTGRAGKSGLAYILLTKQNTKEARFIRSNLRQSGQPISPQLNALCDKKSDERGSMAQNAKNTFKKAMKRSPNDRLANAEEIKESFQRGFILQKAPNATVKRDSKRTRWDSK